MIMKLAILTSSRADYGIYLPLLKRLRADDFFDLRIIAFGTHPSHAFGYTIDQIEADGFEVSHVVESMVQGDSPEAISTAMALTGLKFSALWAGGCNEIDLIVCLGDRYEMFAAVSASIPFNLPVAHIHAGETSLGAIDDTFRHAITLASQYFFVSTQPYAEKVAQLKGGDRHIYNVGALGLDNLVDLELLSTAEFEVEHGIDLAVPTVLVTYHPETAGTDGVADDVEEFVAALAALEQQVLITLPNADTSGGIVRQRLLELTSERESVYAVESLGTLGYFSCMKHCAFLLGNTSSGIIEAASFGRYVINVGARQGGRARGGNVIDTGIDRAEILAAVEQIGLAAPFEGENLYWRGGAGEKILGHLKTEVCQDLTGS